MKSLLRHAVWLGPVLTFAAFISYFLIFVNVPALRDFPWVNLPLVIAGVVLTILGLRQSWGGASLWSRLFQGTGLVASLFFAALFLAYIFVISNQVPEPTEKTLALNQAPAFSLQDANGATVQLDDFRGKRVILVFYRGHW